jgi:hypothetical protein
VVEVRELRFGVDLLARIYFEKSYQHSNTHREQSPHDCSRAPILPTPIARIALAMSAGKRPAHDAFGSSQLVKRSKADANLGSSAVAVVNGSGQNGALIQAVCGYACSVHGMYLLKLQRADRRHRVRAAAHCNPQLWSSPAILERSSQRDSIPPANI